MNDERPLKLVPPPAPAPAAPSGNTHTVVVSKAISIECPKGYGRCPACGDHLTISVGLRPDDLANRCRCGAKLELRPG